MPRPVEGSNRYHPGLDGLRAVAVLAVIAYHLGFGWASGGLLGVEVFFVLSGYLITDLLVNEHRRSGRVDLGQFWLRRAKRLLPALFVMLAAVVVWATLVDPARLAAVRSDLPAAVLYVSNWWFIFHHVSYFARFGPPSPLGHLWSLAIEEQFYVVWPLVVVAAFRLARWRRALVALTVLGAAASAVEMALLYVPGGNPTRVYDGTDTRAFALLIGAALALLLPRARSFGAVSGGARRVLGAVGGAALAGIFVLLWRTGEYSTFLYRGGMVVLSVLTAVVIAVTIHPGARLGRLLGAEPLRWLGERSYAVYLWHYPVIVLTTPVGAQPSLARGTLQVASSVVLAGASWRFVEQPVRTGALGRLWERARRRDWRSVPRIGPVRAVAAGGIVATLSVCVVGLAGLVAPPPTALPTSLGNVMTVPRDPTTTRGTRAPTPTDPSPTTSTTTTTPPSGQGVTAIGDSIMVDAAPYLEQLLPGIAIDAKVGQQLVQAQADVAQLRAQGLIGDGVIVELGTNGPFTAQQLEAFLASLGPMRRIVLVNTRVPRPWEQPVNATIDAVAQITPHARLVDWYDASAATPQYFYPDGVHLDPAGARFYASLLAQAVEAPG
ncbi:MAG: acyltransferase family protein [Actinomycetota bacterium]|nr:acyltransferase family protein [Actinomycetota bacterium]